MNTEAHPLSEIVHRDREIMGGALVFLGTRVPARILIDYLEGGETIDEFLDQFPGVRREQAVALMEWLKVELDERSKSS